MCRSLDRVAATRRHHDLPLTARQRMNQLSPTSAQRTPLHRLADYFNHLRQRDIGWIGMDIGAVSTKLAQLERTAEGYRFAAKWMIGSDDHMPAADVTHAGRLERYLPELRQARRMFCADAAAASVSSSLMDLRLVSLPNAPHEELQAMAAEELIADGGTERVINSAIWPVDVEPRHDGSIRLMAIGFDRDVADGLGRGLYSAGYDPRTLDVVPLAMARAVAMSNKRDDSAITAAIDLSFSQAMLAVTIGGMPTFCRTLRDCSLEMILRPLSERFGTSHRESRHIMMRSGVPDDFETADRNTDLVFPLLSPGLERLAEELGRTLAFIRHELPDHQPERACLFGGGALIKNLAPFLARRCGLPTETWSLDMSAKSDPTEPLFGIAAGLSAAAWEN